MSPLIPRRLAACHSSSTRIAGPTIELYTLRYSEILPTLAPLRLPATSWYSRAFRSNLFIPIHWPDWLLRLTNFSQQRLTFYLSARVYIYIYIYIYMWKLKRQIRRRRYKRYSRLIQRVVKYEQTWPYRCTHLYVQGGKNTLSVAVHGWTLWMCNVYISNNVNS